MKTDHKKEFFICSITESIIKVVRCSVSRNSKMEIADLAAETLPEDRSEEESGLAVCRLLDKMGYHEHPVIFALPPNYATSRYLKVPAQTSQEIEKIVYLQASRYLPYPTEGLVTGYQRILTDREGYTHINLTIVHKDVFDRFSRIFKGSKTKRLDFVLSSYGLCYFYDTLYPKEKAPVMFVDLDSHYAELAIIASGKLLFSRYFKFNRNQPDGDRLLVDEIRKTQEVSVKETGGPAPQKVIVTGGGRKASQELCEFLRSQAGLNVDVLPYETKIGLSAKLIDTISDSQHSWAGLIGLGLRETEESLYLLPKALKEERQRTAAKNDRRRFVFIWGGIFLMWGFMLAIHFNNKTTYLEFLKQEVARIEPEAKPLEEIERRFFLLEARAKQKPNIMDLIYELYQAMPASVSLLNFYYEEGRQVALRGQSADLNALLGFVSQLRKSPAFMYFDTRVKYATQRRAQAGELVDFEVTCLKIKQAP